MGFLIKCSDRHCEHQDTWANDIVDLIQNHTSAEGWLLCECGKKGYIYNNFFLQQGRDIWKPFVMGAIKLQSNNANYQPISLLVSSDPYQPSVPTDIWLSHYSESKGSNGPSAIGCGYRSPMVLKRNQMLELIKRLILLGCFTSDEVGKPSNNKLQKAEQSVGNLFPLAEKMIRIDKACSHNQDVYSNR
ncbi:MAG: hypothetical protein ACP5U1_03550 [Desulfomonilaceae bacterium]